MPKNSSRFILLLCMTACCTLSTFAQVNSTTGLLLNEGVVINTIRNEVYVTTPDNKTEALSLLTGQSLWITQDNMKPLVVANGKLLCQGRVPNQPGKLALYSLDVAQKGKPSLFTTTELSPNVKNNFIRSDNSSFTLQAATSGTTTYFLWEYTGTVKQDNPDSMMISQDKTIIEKGVLRNQSPNKLLVKITESQFPKNLLHRSILADQQGLIPELRATPQFISKDEKHIMSSEKVNSDSVFNNYRWQIYNKDTKRKVGEIADYRSYAPFCVIGKILIYESGPYIHRVGNEVREIPHQLIAIDLDTGKQIWVKQIIDFVYRGPYPS